MADEIANDFDLIGIVILNFHVCECGGEQEPSESRH
jgi:hypothetical protein